MEGLGGGGGGGGSFPTHPPVDETLQERPQCMHACIINYVQLQEFLGLSFPAVFKPGNEPSFQALKLYYCLYLWSFGYLVHFLAFMNCAMRYFLLCVFPKK